jgi:hypothetical protein
MIVSRISPVSRSPHSMDLPVTNEQFADYNQGTLLQHAFPNCTAAEREFIKSGITPDEWTKIFEKDK